MALLCKEKRGTGEWDFFRICLKSPEIPPLQRDYAKAVFLWAFSKPQPIRDDGYYASYFLYECGIRGISEIAAVQDAVAGSVRSW